MGGEIGFSPSIEKGAKFWFYVPCEYTLDKSMAIDNTTNINTIDSIDKFVFNKLLFVNFIKDINIPNYNIDKKISLYSGKTL